VMRVPQHYACRIWLPEKEFLGEGTSFSWR